jgi:hypothetical protein
MIEVHAEFVDIRFGKGMTAKNLSSPFSKPKLPRGSHGIAALPGPGSYCVTSGAKSICRACAGQGWGSVEAPGRAVRHVLYPLKANQRASRPVQAARFGRYSYNNPIAAIGLRCRFKSDFQMRKVSCRHSFERVAPTRGGLIKQSTFGSPVVLARTRTPATRLHRNAEHLNKRSLQTQEMQSP